MEKHTALQVCHTDDSLDIGTDLEPESVSTASIDKNVDLTPKETRRIVTPYAFFVSDDLLGTPLAGPFRRGFGLMIDLFFIFLLTQVSSLVLAAVAAWTFFLAGNRLKTKKRFNTARIFLRLLVALLLFIVAMGIVDDDEQLNIELLEPSIKVDDNMGGEKLIALTAKYLLNTKAMKQQVAQRACEPAYDCFQTLGEKLIQDIVDIGLDRDTIDDALQGYLSSVSESLSPLQQTELTHHLQQFVDEQNTSINSHELKTAELKTAELKTAELIITEQPIIMPINNDSRSEKPHAEPKDYIKRLESLLEELGIGLGWAAFYFSIFTAWWKGQTPGKKLLGMKVIKLDNTPLNLWESFGRYGGYAAGLATGLSGFLQVFWDPNRQAIQDKISETLVIDLRKPKVIFVK